MTSLRSLLATHRSVLLLDTASTALQIGWWPADGPPVWCTREEEAGTGLFAGVEEVLARAGTSLAEVGAFAFNHGPGSILGIRTAAVALRTWHALAARPLYHYSGVVALARARQQGQLGASGDLVVDARRDTWHRIDLGSQPPLGLERVPTAHVRQPCYTPAGFRSWSKLPMCPEEIPYRAEEFLAVTAGEPLFTATDAPEAFLHEDPQYQTWTAQIHRAPN